MCTDINSSGHKIHTKIDVLVPRHLMDWWSWGSLAGPTYFIAQHNNNTMLSVGGGGGYGDDDDDDGTGSNANINTFEGGSINTYRTYFVVDY